MSTNIDIDRNPRTNELLQVFNRHFENISFSEEHHDAYEAVYYFLNEKGKRIRPVLLMHATEMFGGDVSLALNPAFGIELFHNFTLIHDDIMDKAEIRRGQPALHRKFTKGTAILAGDFLMILSYRFLAKVQGRHLKPVLDLFNETATQIIEGQVLDASFEQLSDVRSEDYFKMIEYKTAVLIACSLKIGAILADTSVKNQEKIYDFGKNLGLAFQLKDDWLDAFGDQSVGKIIGGDIMQNKKTLLFIEAWKRSDSDQKKLLSDILNTNDKKFKLEETLRLYNELGVDEEIERLMNLYFKRAITSLEEISLKEERKSPLLNFAGRVYNREY